jgi:hypothetical protein
MTVISREEYERQLEQEREKQRCARRTVCKFCGKPFEEIKTGRLFCNEVCRKNYHDAGDRGLSEISVVDLMIMSKSYFRREPSKSFKLHLDATLADCDWRPLRNEATIIAEGIEKWGGKFRSEDITAIIDMEFACEQLARRAQVAAALLKQARQRAEVLMKTERADVRWSAAACGW